MSKIKEGDVVTLKSGGRAMTVKALHDFNRSYCMWMDNEGNLVSEVFDDFCLKVLPPQVNPPENPPELKFKLKDLL